MDMIGQFLELNERIKSYWLREKAKPDYIVVSSEDFNLMLSDIPKGLLYSSPEVDAENFLWNGVPIVGAGGEWQVREDA
jgi:hypothetical protein